MPGSHTKRMHLTADLPTASIDSLRQEGPFFGLASRTSCTDEAECMFGRQGWQGSPGPIDAVHSMQVTVILISAGDNDMEVEAVGDIAD